MTESHLDLRFDVGQLSAALAGSTDIEHFLYKLSEVSHKKFLAGNVRSWTKSHEG